MGEAGETDAPWAWLRVLTGLVYAPAIAELERTLPMVALGIDRERLVAEPVLIEVWRDTLREALDTQDLAHPLVGLGVTLWGADILSALLGRHAPVHQRLMARMAGEHWLGQSIRVSIGSFTNLAGTYDMTSFMIGGF
jgi:hypothetical protein